MHDALPSVWTLTVRRAPDNRSQCSGMPSRGQLVDLPPPCRARSRHGPPQQLPPAQGEGASRVDTAICAPGRRAALVTLLTMPDARL